MELRNYIVIIRRWLWLILLCIILAAAGAFLFSRQQMPIYAAQATVLLDNSRSAGGVQANYQDLLANERLARTYAELFSGREVLQAVQQELGYAPEFLNISVSPRRDTTLLVARVESNDPEAAAFIATRLPEIVSERQRLRQAERYAATKAGLTQELAALEADIAQTRDALAETAPTNDAEIARLNSALSLQERSYETLLQNLSAIRLAEAQDTDVLSLVEPARVPQTPIRPRIPTNTLMAALVGLMIGLGAVFLIEYLDDTLKEDSDLTEQLGVNLLAAIGKVGEGEKRTLITELNHNAPVAEAYRMLRTNIRFALVDTPLQTVMVTSPGPSEGKSTTAANLAVVMAQAGHRTILVDADLRRPVQHKLFDVPNKEGLTSALVERESTLTEYLRDTGVENLRVLPAGPLPPNPSELLGSQRMREVVAELQREADLVILDTPPVLAVTDSALIASSISGALLVLRAGQTHLEAARRAVEQLQGVQATILGAVMNGVREGREGYYYYYEYYSSEGGGAGPKAKPATFGARMRALLVNTVPLKRG
jgi:polysaccharide biosynthesis transport protein